MTGPNETRTGRHRLPNAPEIPRQRTGAPQAPAAQPWPAEDAATTVLPAVRPEPAAAPAGHAVRADQATAPSAVRPAPEPAPDAERTVALRAATPVERGPRVLGVDLARGLALFGIIAVHALVEGTDDGAPAANYLVLGGRSAALFALLAGVGFAFMTGRARVRPGVPARSAVAALGTRAGLLLVLGLALGWTDPEIAAVILPYYAVMFLLAIPLVLLPSPALVGVGVVIAAGIPVLSQLVRPALPVPTLDNPTLADVVTDPLGLLSELTLTGAYPALPWLAYLCAGIVVGRLRLDTLRTAVALLLGGLAAAGAATALSWFLLGPFGGYDRIAAATPPALLDSAPTVVDFVNASPDGVTPTTTWWWLATVAPHSGTPLDLVQTTGSALAVLGTALLLARLPGRLPGHLLRPVAAAGSMTLTLYAASLLFMNSSLDDFAPLTGYLWQVVAALVIAVAWRRAVGRGPLEAAVSMLAQAARDRVRRRGDRDRPLPRAGEREPVAARGPGR